MTGEKTGEFRGKTVEAAISVGLAEWNLSRADVEVEVVRAGSRGVLGIGAEEAIVRLTTVRATKQDARPAPKPEQRSSQRPETRAAPKAAQPAESPVASKASAAPAPEAPAKQLAESVTLPEGEAPAPVRLGQTMLAGLLQQMGLQATVEIKPQSEAEADEDERVLVLNVVGDDLGALIGRQSEVLSALEFITRLMVNQQSHARSSFIVDVNGYRAKRAESLRKLALRMADQAAQAGRTMALEPMTPAERRIIHIALRDHPEVKTHSVGEGERRKVTIIPNRD